MGRTRQRPARAPALIVAVSVAALAIPALLRRLALVEPAETTWLCRPGRASNPCLSSRGNDGRAGQRHDTSSKRPSGDSKPPIDCFYVYPTVCETGRPRTRTSKSNRRRRRSRSTRRRASRRSARCTRRCIRSSRCRRSKRRAGSPPKGANGLPRRARGVRGIPGEVQQRPRLRADRPLAGLADAREADQGRDRHESGAAQTSSSRRILLGGNVLVPEGQLVGGTFRTRPRLHIGGYRDALRDRVLELPQRTAGRPVYFGRPGQPAAAGGVRPVGKEVVCVNPTLLSRTARAGS